MLSLQKLVEGTNSKIYRKFHLIRDIIFYFNKRGTLIFGNKNDLSKQKVKTALGSEIFNSFDENHAVEALKFEN